VADPGASAVEFALVVAVAAGQRNDAFGARTTFALEILEGRAQLLATLQEANEPQGVLERERSALAGLRTGGVGGISRQNRPSERRLHALACSAVLDQRPRHKPAKADQAGIERFWAIGHDMGSHHRMHAVGADQEVTLGAGAVGKVRDHALIGAVLDADQPLVKEELDVLAPRLVYDRLVEGGPAHVHRRPT